MKNDPTQGVLITIENLEQMPMPVVIEFKTKSGAVSRQTLPVEIWKRNTSWTFRHDSSEELAKVVIDPDYVLPDVNSANNKWKASDGTESVEILSVYTGDFSSTTFPMPLTLVEANSVLELQLEGQPSVPLESEGNGEFVFEEAGLKMKFNAEKTGFNLEVNGQTFEFTKN